MSTRRKNITNTATENSSPDDNKKKAAKSSPTNSRGVILWILVGLASLVPAIYFFLKPSGIQTFVGVDEIVPRKAMSVECSNDYDGERELFPGCPPVGCRRVVMDSIVTQEEATHMLSMAKAGFSLGSAAGGASILDLHTGALSHGQRFIDIYSLFDDENDTIFLEKDFVLYREIKNKIRDAIMKEFNIPEGKLYLANPTFFSRMDKKPPITVHDEYWQLHVDKETYGSFHYTSLLYLADYGNDFEGGRFIFTNATQNVTVEPRLGRVSFFTSGSENPHYVERVTSGTRYAITVSFTCDPDKAIGDPTLRWGKVKHSKFRRFKRA